MKLTIQNLKNWLIENNETANKKTCHLSNDILIRVCDTLTSDDEIEFELTRSREIVNRGTTFEILFKEMLNERYGLSIPVAKSTCGHNDLDKQYLTKEVCEDLGLPFEDLEIKLSTSFANGSKIKNLKGFVLVANQDGAWLGQAKDLDLDKKGSVRPNQFKFKRLAKLSEILGY